MSYEDGRSAQYSRKGKEGSQPVALYFYKGWYYIIPKLEIKFMFRFELFRGLCQILDRDERFPMIIGLHQRWKTLRDAKSSISRSVLSTKIRGGRLSSKKPVCFVTINVQTVGILIKFCAIDHFILLGKNRELKSDCE